MIVSSGRGAISSMTFCSHEPSVAPCTLGLQSPLGQGRRRMSVSVYNQTTDLAVLSVIGHSVKNRDRRLARTVHQSNGIIHYRFHSPLRLLRRAVVIDIEQVEKE